MLNRGYWLLEFVSIPTTFIGRSRGTGEVISTRKPMATTPPTWSPTSLMSSAAHSSCSIGTWRKNAASREDGRSSDRPRGIRSSSACAIEPSRRARALTRWSAGPSRRVRNGRWLRGGLCSVKSLLRTAGWGARAQRVFQIAIAPLSPACWSGRESSGRSAYHPETRQCQSAPAGAIRLRGRREEGCQRTGPGFEGLSCQLARSCPPPKRGQ